MNDQIVSRGDRSEQRMRVQSYNSIALTLFYDQVREKGFPHTEDEAREAIDRCVTIAKTVDDRLYEEIAPLL